MPHREVVGLVLFQLLERDIHRIFKGFIVLADFHGVDQLDERGKVLLFLGRFIMDVADQGTVQKRLCLHPEIVAGFAVSLGIADQGVDQFQNILFRVDVGEGVIVHTLGKVDGIEYLDAVIVPLQQPAALDHDAALRVGDNV